MTRTFSLWLVVLILAACSSSIDPPASFPADHTLREGDRVAVALPEAWVHTVPKASDYQDVANSLREQNPSVAAQMDEMATELGDDILRFFAVYNDGFTTMNITSERLPPTQNTAAQANANRRGLENFGYTILEESRVEINDQTFERTEAQILVTRQDGTPLTMMLVQYTIVKGSRAYSISFGTPKPFLAELESDFAQIVSTFHTIED